MKILSLGRNVSNIPAVITSSDRPTYTQPISRFSAVKREARSFIPLPRKRLLNVDEWGSTRELSRLRRWPDVYGFRGFWRAQRVPRCEAIFAYYGIHRVSTNRKNPRALHPHLTPPPLPSRIHPRARIPGIVRSYIHRDTHNT